MIRACRGPVPAPHHPAWVPHLWWEDDAPGETRGGVVVSKTCPACSVSRGDSLISLAAQQEAQASTSNEARHKEQIQAAIRDNNKLGYANQNLQVENVALRARIRRLEGRLARVIEIAAAGSAAVGRS